MPTFNLTNRTLDNLRSGLNMAGDLVLPQKASYAVLKNGSAIAAALKEYDAQVSTLLVEFARKDDKGSPIAEPIEGGRVRYSIDPERADEYVERRNDLDDFIVENVTIHFVPEAVMDAFGGSITPKDLSLIAWMIEGLSTLESAAVLPERAPDPSP